MKYVDIQSMRKHAGETISRDPNDPRYKQESVGKAYLNEFLSQLVPSAKNATRGVIRGAASSIPWTAQFLARIPYNGQRLYSIATGKYKDKGGFLNKWEASKHGEQYTDSKYRNLAKALSESADDWYGQFQHGLDEMPDLKYDEGFYDDGTWQSAAAKDLAEGAGFTLFNAGTLGMAKNMKPLHGRFWDMLDKIGPIPDSADNLALKASRLTTKKMLAKSPKAVQWADVGFRGADASKWALWKPLLNQYRAHHSHLPTLMSTVKGTKNAVQ